MSLTKLTKPRAWWATFKLKVAASVSRSLYDKLAERGLSPADFGGVPDWKSSGTTTDNTDAFAACVAAASTVGNGTIRLDGKYAVRQVVIVDGITIRGSGRVKSGIYGHPDATAAEKRALVASSSFLGKGEHSNSNIEIHNTTIDGRGDYEFSCALRTWNSEVKDCSIMGATNTDMLWSTTTYDGDKLGAQTMVNNRCLYNLIGRERGTADYGLQVRDPSNKATDMNIVGNYLSGHKVANSKFDALAGYHISGNHLYGAPVSTDFSRGGGFGTRIDNNFFENDIVFGTMLSSDKVFRFGTGNYIRGAVRLDFGNTGTNIYSEGNTYLSTVTHNYFFENKVFISKNDTFLLDDPFRFQNPTSNGRMVIENAFLATSGEHISSSFSGNKIRWKTLIPATTGKFIPVFGAKYTSQGGGAKSHVYTCELPDNGASTTLEVVIHTGLNFTKGGRIAYTATLGVIKNISSGALMHSVLDESIDSSDFSIPPTLTVNTVGGKMEVTLSYTPATSDGYGQALIRSY